MNRRVFLKTSAASALSGVCVLGDGLAGSARGADRPRAPFRVLYSNDMTHVAYCISPYHKRGEKWTPEMFLASVDETAARGVDVHMLQPGLGWIPWWQSEVYSMAEHREWWKACNDGDVCTRPVHRFLLDGGDPVRLFVERCRQKGLAPFISLRMNDCHYLHLVNDKENFTQSANEAICRFYAEHPDWWLSTTIWKNGMDWTVPEVRDYRFALIEELCNNYDIDGLEMDFMRFPNYFREAVPYDERAGIMAAFIARVRTALDKRARGKRRWLCMRVPVLLKWHRDRGIDVRRDVDAGVDMINLSAFYYTQQQSDTARICAMTPQAAVYLEMCHCTTSGERRGASWGDARTYRRTTDEQYYTGAHLAYSRGGAGVSLFNFVYYRQHGHPNRGPFCEPPFHVLQHLGDPAWLARQPQHYVVGAEKDYRRATPFRLAPGGQVQWETDMAPPTGGWTQAGVLRIQTQEALGDAALTASINGHHLDRAPHTSEPYPNPYPPLLGTPETLAAWAVPATALRDGVNTIEVAQAGGVDVDIIFVDLAVA